jgi:hypothetical protein
MNRTRNQLLFNRDTIGFEGFFLSGGAFRLPSGIPSHKPFQRISAVPSAPYLPGISPVLEGYQEGYTPMMALAEATLELKSR